MSNNLTVKFYGESHGQEIGFTVCGLPAKKKIDVQSLKDHVKRRQPSNDFSTARKEADDFVFTEGVDENFFTTGQNLTVVVKNSDVIKKDYTDIKYTPRPSHADYVSYLKHGYIKSGGGEFSGRMTVLLTILGGIAEQFLKEENIQIVAYVSSVYDKNFTGYEDVDVTKIDVERIKKMPIPMLNESHLSVVDEIFARAKEERDSVGGTVECVVLGLKGGLGDCLYGSVEGEISKGLFAIPAVKGVEFGKGFDISSFLGSQVADELYFDGEEIKTYTNYNGGINGGVTNGMPITLRVAFKPVPSIGKPLRTVNLKTKEQETISVEGRHDVCFVPRASVVVESVVAWEIFKLLKGET